MIGRKQEPNLQFQQILDGAILVAAFWAAYAVLSALPPRFNLVSGTPSFDDARWVLFILMPFGPIILELFDFYRDVPRKSPLMSVVELGFAGIFLSLVILITAFIFRYNLPSRAVFAIFTPLASGMLLGRERFTSAYLRRKSQHA